MTWKIAWRWGSMVGGSQILLPLPCQELSKNPLDLCACLS